MFACSFELNGKPLSNLELDDAVKKPSFPAFSGQAPHTNSRLSACVKGVGPIPPGRYYIFDRQSGGRLEWVRNLFSDHSLWFALYAIDDKIDDETLCDKIKRGSFRLHPKGPRGISEGCITIDQLSDFHLLRTKLQSKPAESVPGTDLKAYGLVVVT